MRHPTPSRVRCCYCSGWAAPLRCYYVRTAADCRRPRGCRGPPPPRPRPLPRSVVPWRWRWACSASARSSARTGRLLWLRARTPAAPLAAAAVTSRSAATGAYKARGQHRRGAASVATPSNARRDLRPLAHSGAHRSAMTLGAPAFQARVAAPFLRCRLQRCARGVASFAALSLAVSYGTTVTHRQA